MTRRYYVPDLPPAGGPVALSGAEAQHACRVMRVDVGERITLFDGRGHEADGWVMQVDRRSCLCDAEQAQRVDRESPRELNLAVALPRPERGKEMVERLTELGVRRLIPIVAERTQRSPSPNQLEKLRRAVVEACKQSGRNVLLEIDEPAPLEPYLAGVSGSSRGSNPHPTASQDDRPGTVPHQPDSKAQCWILQPGGTPIGEAVEESLSLRDSSVNVLIGPEGGWTPGELAAATDKGFTPICLGPRIYRIETAATNVAAVIAAF